MAVSSSERVEKVLRQARRGLRRFRHQLSGAEEHYDRLDLEILRARFVKARDDDSVSVSPNDLMAAATLRAPQMRIGAGKHALGEEFYPPLHFKWKSMNPNGSIGVFPPHGIVMFRGDAPARLDVNLSPIGAPDFDWTVAREMLNRIDTTSDLAVTWLRSDRARLPHLERAYAVATQILGAVQRERWRRQRTRMGSDEPPTDAFNRELDAIRPRLEEAERAFSAVAEQNAQNLYVAGMFAGGLILAVASGIGAFLFWHFGLAASIGLAFPAGGVGAVVSVLQRVTTGQLEVDYAASPRRLLVFGAVRPWIGAVFGIVVYALLKSQIVGLTVDPPAGLGVQLAFFGVLGFLAGFNERFAQDVVSGSSARLGEAMIDPGGRR